MPIKGWLGQFADLRMGVAKIREEGEIPQCTLSVTTVNICLRFCFLSLLEIKGIELSD